LPPLAIQAGLGELGRNNILIADKYGSRVRIGAITTDMPIENHSPISLGVNQFCTICKKCSDNCPSKALESGRKLDVNGVLKWPTNVENCYTLWRKYGTDCGICMVVCPFSHKNNLLHNCIRLIVKYFPILNRFLIYMDNLIYGKKWKSK
jgi:reductive dehalogenase